jgi:uncharacterized damage-inducible protein DinB
MSDEQLRASGAATPAALLYPDMDAELATTRRMLERVPMEHRDWRPHAKSGTLLGVAAHVAQLPSFATAIAMLDVLQFDPAAFKTPPLNTTDDLVGLFDTKAAEMRSALTSLDWTRLNGNWKMMMGDQVFVDGQRAFLLRNMGISHMVHHRAQLGVYLRLLDVAIPGSYGPSADGM